MQRKRRAQRDGSNFLCALFVLRGKSETTLSGGFPGRFDPHKYLVIDLGCGVNLQVVDEAPGIGFDDLLPARRGVAEGQRQAEHQRGGGAAQVPAGDVVDKGVGIAWRMEAVLVLLDPSDVELPFRDALGLQAELPELLERFMDVEREVDSSHGISGVLVNDVACLPCRFKSFSVEAAWRGRAARRRR